MFGSDFVQYIGAYFQSLSTRKTRISELEYGESMK
jgi:hypothetical protein